MSFTRSSKRFIKRWAGRNRLDALTLVHHHQINQPAPPGGGGPSADAYLQEDGSSFFLLEDGTSFLLLE